MDEGIKMLKAHCEMQIRRGVDRGRRFREHEVTLELIDRYENSIPKQKIQDKIYEINKTYEDSKDEDGESIYYYPDYTIRILEELLENKEGE